MSGKQTAESFGKALRKRRKELGLNQVDVCNLAGVGAVFLYDLERGKPSVRLDKVLAVLEVLGLGLELRESHQVLSTGLDAQEDGR